MTRRMILLTLVLGLLGCGKEPPGTLEYVTIRRGATVAAVADTLAARGIVDHPGFFRFYASVTGRSRDIKAGTYQLSRNLGTRGALAVLVRGQPALRSLLVTEGLMLPEIAAAVERQVGVPAESLLAAAADTALVASLAIPRPTVEGYLYPSTYMVPLDVRAKDIVLLMTQEFTARWRPQWTGRLDTLGFSRHELVTLASIIEGEVRHAEDRRFVSSVYHNRLRRGMRLQADPTVIYALGIRRRLFERDYERASPYNTYLIDGLPPGPVGSPSEASIEAALYPAKSDFLYFVARADGRHVFSRTYAEHVRTIQGIRNGS